MSNLAFSITCAIIHVIFELINIIVESRSSNTSIMHYSVTCYNSRENWLPRESEFNFDGENADLIEIDKPGLFCNNTLGFKIGFKFTNLSFDTIIYVLSNMTEQEFKSQPTLLIDDCFNDIDFEKIVQLTLIAKNKLKLVFSQEYLSYLKI